MFQSIKNEIQILVFFIITNRPSESSENKRHFSKNFRILTIDHDKNDTMYRDRISCYKDKGVFFYFS